MVKPSALRTVVMTARYTDLISYFDDWMAAFEASPLFDVVAFNICADGTAARLRHALRDADAVILLHSTNGDTTGYIDPLVPVLNERKCPLLTFVGNEVNLPGARISAKRELFARLRPEYIATQLLLEGGKFLFDDVAVRRVVAVPHALNPAVFRFEKPHGERRWDIGGRAVRYAPHLGDDDRNRLHDFFIRHSFAPELKVDINNQRFDRAGWADFLNDCRGTVSSEAGSWFIERDDATTEAIRAWTKKQTGRGGPVLAHDGLVEAVARRVPAWVRRPVGKLLKRTVIRTEASLVKDLDFREVYETFFANRPIPEIHGKCISSRHFDAIGAGTCQILLEGRYNDILEPGRHYIPLANDYSNIEEVMDTFRDDRRRGEIVEAAREHVLAHHTHAHRAREIHDLLTSSGDDTGVENADG